MKKLLWVGDAGCPSGFARVTHETLDVLRETWDVTVLGINYRGDPHKYPYPLYAAGIGGDPFGVERLIWMMDLVQPDMVVLLNDPWNIPFYTKRLKRFSEYANVPVVGSIAVDGLNCKGEGMNDLALGVFWTDFGLMEARRGGFRSPGCVIPLGVDTTTYYPTDRQGARQRRGLDVLGDKFIVGNVNRNQPRKRMDLTIRYFAEWVRQRKIGKEAMLYLHIAPTGDSGYDCLQLATYYGVKENLAFHAPPEFYGITDDEMRDTYNSFNVMMTTTQGEGFGFTTMEGMACGVPQIVPAWSALKELTNHGASIQIPCTSTAATHANINVIGGIMDETQAVETLHACFTHPEILDQFSELGIARASEERFQWRQIGEEFRDAIKDIP